MDENKSEDQAKMSNESAMATEPNTNTADEGEKIPVVARSQETPGQKTSAEVDQQAAPQPESSDAGQSIAVKVSSTDGEVKPAPPVEEEASENTEDAPNLDTTAAEAVAPEVKPATEASGDPAPVPQESSGSGMDDPLTSQQEVKKESDSPEKNSETLPPQEPASAAVQAAPQSEVKSDPGSQAQVGVAASQMANPKHPHRNNKKLAAIMTIVIALLLSAIAVYVYMGANSNTEEATSTDSSDQQQTELTQLEQEAPAEPATTEDVDQVSQDLEEAINALDEAADFSDEALTDTSLGL